MEKLFRLKDDCRADVLTVDIRGGIMTIRAVRQKTGCALTKCITEEQLRECVLSPYETVKRLMHEFTAKDVKHPLYDTEHKIGGKGD